MKSPTKKKKNTDPLIFHTNSKFQDPISNCSWPYAKRNGRTDAWMHARTHADAQTNMPLNFSEVGAIKTYY